MRKLADETRKQSSGITETIKQISQKIEETVGLTDRAVLSVEKGQQANALIHGSLNEIVSVSSKLGELTVNTQAQLEEQRSAAECIVHAATSLSEFTQGTIAMAAYLKRTSDEFSGQALEV